MGIGSISHWLLVLFVCFIVFGTKRLKTIGYDLGVAIKGLRRGLAEDADKDVLDPEKIRERISKKRGILKKRKRLEIISECPVENDHEKVSLSKLQSASSVPQDISAQESNLQHISKTCNGNRLVVQSKRTRVLTVKNNTIDDVRVNKKILIQKSAEMTNP